MAPPIGHLLGTVASKRRVGCFRRSIGTVVGAMGTQTVAIRYHSSPNHKKVLLHTLPLSLSLARTPWAREPAGRAVFETVRRGTNV